MNIAALVLGAICGTFAAAEPVWHAGHEEEMNEQLVFRGDFSCDDGDRPVLKIASSNPYRVTLN